MAESIAVLPDETQEDHDRTRRHWVTEFEPEGYMEERLVEILIENDWLLKRAVRRLHQAEARQQDDVELKLRNKYSAERSFYRSLNALRQLRKDVMRIEEKHSKQLEKENQQLREELEKRPPAPAERTPVKQGEKGKVDAPKTLAQQMFRGQNHPKKQKKVPILDQWIEIETVDGKTVTALYPPNEQLIKEGKAMLPPPEMVYRRLHFVGAVPPEYYWTTDDERKRAIGGSGIQRMTIDTWLEVIEREKNNGTGHIGPCGGNLPRPEERGGCDCEVCTHNRAVLEARES
jgi:hypothetical protein